jgi:hypothetical protein
MSHSESQPWHDHVVHSLVRQGSLTQAPLLRQRQLKGNSSLQRNACVPAACATRQVH